MTQIYSNNKYTILHTNNSCKNRSNTREWKHEIQRYSEQVLNNFFNYYLLNKSSHRNIIMYVPEIGTWCDWSKYDSKDCSRGLSGTMILSPLVSNHSSPLRTIRSRTRYDLSFRQFSSYVSTAKNSPRHFIFCVSLLSG